MNKLTQQNSEAELRPALDHTEKTQSEPGEIPATAAAPLDEVGCDNRTMLQYFEWYLPADQTLWRRAAHEAAALRRAGITDIWLPPAYKGAAGKDDVGYGVYDSYDLGEFDQKGSIPTKYGTRDEYLAAIRGLQSAGLHVYADIVLNHRMGADGTEELRATEQDPDNRLESVSEPESITAWTVFDFPGRAGKYSGFRWDSRCFDGTDHDAASGKNAIYLFEGKHWDRSVDSEHGNFDYLMGANVDFSSDEVRQELLTWGRWYRAITGVDGFRLDAVKHIRGNFFSWWLYHLREDASKNLPAIGEYWSSDVEVLKKYLETNYHCMTLFDVPLHFNFYRAAREAGTFSMRHLLDNTLLRESPENAVTFVDNHDSQPGQALFSWVDGWFKAQAYALILLYGQGLPCVFWGDLYGVPHDNIGPVPLLPMLIKLRQLFAYGKRYEYFDDDDLVGFTRLGDNIALTDEIDTAAEREAMGLDADEAAAPDDAPAELPTDEPVPAQRIYTAVEAEGGHSESGLAVVLTDGHGGSKHMYVGRHFAGRYFHDCTGRMKDDVLIDENGFGDFTVSDGSLAVYVTKEAAELLFVQGFVG